MSQYYSGPASDFADARDLDALESKVRELEDALNRRIDSVESDQSRLLSSVDELSDDVRRRADDARSLRTEVEQLQRRVQRQTGWIQRAIALRTDAVAELDAPGEDIREWAAALRRGNAVGAQLLSETTRDRHEATLGRYRSWLKQSRDLDEAFLASVDAAAAASDVPADADWSAYDAGKTNADQHRETGRYLQQQAEAAKAALDNDDALRASYKPVLEAHKVAADKLTDVISERLVAMLKKGQTPPLWFVLALGDVPPEARQERNDPDVADWVDTAIMLVRYRIIYGVTDPIEALGRPTYPSAVQEQRREINARAIAKYM
jgi:chromosome segregation ATPase